MDRLVKYAKLLISEGVSLKRGQPLFITGHVENFEFVRLVTGQAYEMGAREVFVRWVDEVGSRLKYIHGAGDLFDTFPEFQKQMYEHYDNQNSAYLRISAANPEALKGVDPERMQRWNITSSKALKARTDMFMASKFQWCVAAAPSKEWAKKVFPDLCEADGVSKLWDAILQSSRVDDGDPVAAWREHSDTLARRSAFLNEKGLTELRLKNSLGTNLSVKLPQNHIWQGGAEKMADGHLFSPNIPTEEIFTAPHRLGTNGRVVASMPLAYQGDLIEDFELTFENGRVVSYRAGKNERLLKNLLETDEGSRYLGEIALVPYDSPISRMKIMFYETLFDENASCHIALGEAYPTCVKGASDLDDEKKKELGLNVSYSHSDFMIGTPDLEITGVLPDGGLIQVFKDGNFAI